MLANPFIIREFLDIFLESTGIDPAHVLPDTPIEEIGLSEKCLETLKINLEAHFDVYLDDIDELKKRSSREIVNELRMHYEESHKIPMAS